jgi:hypothetical protein
MIRSDPHELWAESDWWREQGPKAHQYRSPDSIDTEISRQRSYNVAIPLPFPNITVLLYSGDIDGAGLFQRPVLALRVSIVLSLHPERHRRFWWRAFPGGPFCWAIEDLLHGELGFATQHSRPFMDH